MMKRLPWPEGTELSLGAEAGPPNGRAGLAAGGEGALGSFTGQKPWQWGSRREGGGQAGAGQVCAGLCHVAWLVGGWRVPGRGKVSWATT